jgi:transposase
MISFRIHQGPEGDMRPAKQISERELNELEGLLKTAKSKADFQRVQCLWLRGALGMHSTQIAVAVGLKSGTVKRIQSEYFSKGISALIRKGRGGRHHEYLSVEEEKRLLAGFIEKSKAAGVLVVSEVKAAYEKAVGRTVPKSTVYRMLARHGWRKLVPRPRHPKGNPLEAEAFKKNCPNLSRKKPRGIKKEKT